MRKTNQQVKSRIHISIAVVFGLLFGHSFCIAQANTSFDPVLESQSIASINGTIDLVNDGFETKDTNEPDKMSTSEIHTLGASVVDGELIITYTLVDPSDKQKIQDKYYNEQINHTYHADVTLTYDGQKLYIRPDRIIGNIYNDVNGHSGTKTIIVTRLQESFVQLDGSLIIELILNHRFELDPEPQCEEGKPRFDFPQKVPYLVGAVAGAGLIVGGLLLEQQSKEDYKTYQEQTDRQLGDQWYEKANDRHVTAQWLTYAGIGVLALDITLYFIKSSKHKKQTYLYEKYCPNAHVGVSPYINLPRSNSTNGNFGVAISYTFE